MSRNKQPIFNYQLKFLLIACLIILLIIMGKQFNFSQLLHQSIIGVNNLGVLGPLAFIIIYNIGTLLFIPGSVLTAKGGCLFGLFWGSVYVLIAATLGATIAFLIGRYLSRSWVCKQIGKNPKFQAIDRAVAKEGLKIVLLTRLSPIFPFNLLNYALGVTQVSLKDYILGSIGMIPGTVMYVYMGSVVTDIAMINTNSQPTTPEVKIAQWLIQGIGLIATIVVTIYVTKIAQKVLKQTASIN